jgi:hypothetical protein
MRDLSPIRPGEQLREEYVKPLGLTAYWLAKDIGVPVTRVQAPSLLCLSHRSQSSKASAVSPNISVGLFRVGVKLPRL